MSENTTSSGVEPIGIDTLGIVGAGAFGTALAIEAARAGRRVLLWGRNEDAMREMAATRVNARHLPGLTLPPAIKIALSIEDLAEASALLLTTPAQTTRDVAELIAPLAEAIPIVICAKGIERESGLFPSDIIRAARPQSEVAVLSGPSFARDVAAGLPTAVVLAADDVNQAERLARALNSSSLRVYHSSDRRGVEIGGAAKNVLAIAAGIVEARGLGESAKAALIARGFAEMRRFAIACGGEAETLMGLSGLGDLVLTCGSAKSRNFSYGLSLGRGASPADAARGPLSEGALTAHTLVELAEARGVDMPVCTAVAAIIDGRLTILQAIEQLVSRPQRAE